MRRNFSRIDVQADESPRIGRIIICSDWEGDIKDARRALSKVCNGYPQGVRTDFLIACGGFVSFELPEKLKAQPARDPTMHVLNKVIGEARKAVDEVLDGGIFEKLAQRTCYVSFGVDSAKGKVSTTNTHITETHTELVVLVDLKSGTYHWTGKSYPSSGQEDSLIRMTELGSHFMESEFGNVMVLGCHDLSVFNNRGLERAGEWRKGIKMNLRELARKERPVVVLQHPHVTDTHKTWYNSWSNMGRLVPSVEEYAGSGRYYNHGSERASLSDVLQKTKRGSTIDFVMP